MNKTNAVLDKIETITAKYTRCEKDYIRTHAEAIAERLNNIQNTKDDETIKRLKHEIKAKASKIAIFIVNDQYDSEVHDEALRTFWDDADKKEADTYYHLVVEYCKGE